MSNKTVDVEIITYHSFPKKGISIATIKFPKGITPATNGCLISGDNAWEIVGVVVLDGLEDVFFDNRANQNLWDCSIKQTEGKDLIESCKSVQYLVKE
jgi:hypothetical protein